ncbi:mitochondrial intermembrane space import and assembly protein 40 homolog [Selaginella moellendorffii]|uniref:mitochondrial intermembrane space import and assembly protein 40 homolog n=1 Tax=Selaginella moellendorffii TaxID=88036 RepID=UPI000D1C8FA0|nr:mitochondrial intermembrane space import and assembly protein 40 homolog [Selaginella moellendorffii]|eukprot:XP_024526414.1 mitochondrial intermembrane space import and assembly protein 40 homolog [Selaginella moellendorffii]
MGMEQQGNEEADQGVAQEATVQPENEKEPESLDDMARKALECPCVADLREGPCGKQFSEAFVCYFKSTAEEKGSDCIEPYLAMQACMEATPELFAKHDPDDGSDPNVGERPPSRRRRSKTPASKQV